MLNPRKLYLPLFFLFTFQAGSAPADILVGNVGSLTGSEATFGTSTKKGLELAVAELNAAGGVKGQKIKLIVLDDQGKPEEAATAVTRLITRDKVTAILGEFASSNSLAMAPIAQANKVPMISHGSTNPRVTETGDYIFRTCFIDPFQGTVMARFTANTLNLKKAAILQDLKNDYSMGLAKFFKQTFIALGGQIVSEQSYSKGDIDFKAQLTTIRAAKPEFVFLPGYYTDVGLIVRQARELGIDAPFGGGDGWDSEKIYEIGGKALDGSYISNHYSAEAKDPVLRKFVANYKTKYGSVPDSIAALAYDAVYVLADAIHRAKSLNGPDLRDAISATRNIRGATGTITLGKDRNPVKPAVILKIEGNRQHYVATVAP